MSTNSKSPFLSTRADAKTAASSAFEVSPRGMTTVRPLRCESSSCAELDTRLMNPEDETTDAGHRSPRDDRNTLVNPLFNQLYMAEALHLSLSRTIHEEL